jgi:hypothetical protein
LGGLDRLGCIFGVELGTGADQLAGGWVVDLEGLAGGGLDPFAVDIADVGLEKGGILELVRVKYCSATVSGLESLAAIWDSAHLGSHC